MTLQEEIILELKAAMLNKNNQVRDLLRVVIGEMNREGKIVPDEKVVSIIKKMIENAKLTNQHTEIPILEEYLPKQLTEDQLTCIIQQLVEDKNYSSLKDMGKIMTDLKVEFSGQYDGKVATSIIKNLFVTI